MTYNQASYDAASAVLESARAEDARTEAQVLAVTDWTNTAPADRLRINSERASATEALTAANEDLRRVSEGLAKQERQAAGSPPDLFSVLEG